jgi:hypothetical protein
MPTFCHSSKQPSCITFQVCLAVVKERQFEFLTTWNVSVIGAESRTAIAAFDILNTSPIMLTSVGRTSSRRCTECGLDCTYQ